ncbi:MAG: glycine oxidase ThiO [Thermoanaerobaculia bacterium]
MTSGADVLIVGGGVIGCALARELAGRGARVALAERGRIGGEASSAAAGLLTPQAESLTRGPLFDVGLLSRDLYPDWIGILEQETGEEVGYRRSGALVCAFTEEEERRLESCRAWQTEGHLSVEAYEAAAIPAALRRHVSERVRRALFFPDEAFVHCPLLMTALASSLELRGVSVHAGRMVLALRVEAGRCRGAQTPAGPLEADAVVDAAGAWAGLLGGLPWELPVRPVRGQIVALRTENCPPAVVQSEEVYLVPRSDGKLLAGATVEEAGFRKEVTAEGVAGLLAAALRLSPNLGGAAFDGAWAGLRPGSPDGLPLLGESGVPGLWLATGHFRNGVLLAPWTARALADRMAGSPVSELAPFSPDRLASPSEAGAARERPGADGHAARRV